MGIRLTIEGWLPESGRAVSSVGRATRLHRVGRRFEPGTAHSPRAPARPLAPRAGTRGKPTADFDQGLDGNGTTAEVTFDRPGTIDYFCDVHQSMDGRVVVE